MTAKNSTITAPKGAASRDSSISLLRLISMSFIVVCHMLQYLGNELAWWFNVGVQIFLCISGFLYGAKNVNPPFPFYRKQFKKILLDYYVVVLPVLCVYWLFSRENISIGKTLAVLTASDTLYGGGHLWFVATILFCYVATPILASYYDEVEKRGESVVLATVKAAILALVVCELFAFDFNSAHVSCFLLGFALRRLDESRRRGSSLRLFCGAVLLLAIVFNSFQILVVYTNLLPLSLGEGLLGGYFGLFCDYSHALLGCSLFLVGRWAFAHIDFSGRMASLILGVSDEYSYDVYLVHQFLILGPFSLMAITPFLGLNIACILVLVCVLAWVVRKASLFIGGFRFAFSSLDAEMMKGR